MNENVPNQSCGTPKCRYKIKRHHLYLLGTLILIAAVVGYLTNYASRDTALAGFVALGTLTMIVALASFFKAYEKD